MLISICPISCVSLSHFSHQLYIKPLFRERLQSSKDLHLKCARCYRQGRGERHIAYRGRELLNYNASSSPRSYLIFKTYTSVQPVVLWKFAGQPPCAYATSLWKAI